MSKALAKLLEGMRNNPKGVRFADLCRVCDSYFGECRNRGSHRIYTVSNGQPIVIQEGPGGKAKPYQVRQVLQALDDLGPQE